MTIAPAASLTSLATRVRRRTTRALDNVTLLAHQHRASAAISLYLGFTGFGNLGDEAVLAAIRRGLPERDIRDSDYGRWTMRAQRFARPSSSTVQEIILGGGTLVGLVPWGSRLAQLCDIFPDAARWTIGVGVEDPAALARPDHDVWHREFDQFVDLAPTFARLSVRGPRSQTLLASAGIDAPWVGDPALALGPRTPTSTFAERSLLVTPGRVDRLEGSSPELLCDATAAALRSVIDDGWRVTVASLSPLDLSASAELARRLGAGDKVRVTSLVTDWAGFQSMAVRHHVGVHLRLHAGVLAAAAFAPFLQLGYLPKCQDFAESIAHVDHTISVSGLTAEHLLDRIRGLAATRDEVQRRLFVEVSRVRNRLDAEFAAVRKLVP